MRDRLEDVPLLARHFVDRFSRQANLGRVEIDPAVLGFLPAYPWPGNVRELRNVIERTIVRLRIPTITLADLPNELRRGPANANAEPLGPRVSWSNWQLMFDRMVTGRETFWTFWSAVYEPFMTRDVTRQHVREIGAHGLERTRGNYRELAELFNIKDRDFKRFVGLLRRYGCVPLTSLRARMIKVAGVPGALEPVPSERFGNT